MSEKSREAWAKIIANRRAAAAARRGEVQEANLAKVVVAPVVAQKVTKTAENCGQPQCCMRIGAAVTHEGPTVLRDGFDLGAYHFAANIKPPLICAGDLWIPRVKSDYEKHRDERLTVKADGFKEFAAKKPSEPSKYCKHGRPRNHCA